MLKLIGYADRFSVAPGETIRFMVSALDGQAYRAEIVRLIHGDANPEGPGLQVGTVSPARRRHLSRQTPGDPHRLLRGRPRPRGPSRARELHRRLHDLADPARKGPPGDPRPLVARPATPGLAARDRRGRLPSPPARRRIAASGEMPQAPPCIPATGTSPPSLRCRQRRARRSCSGRCSPMPGPPTPGWPRQRRLPRPCRQAPL